MIAEPFVERLRLAVFLEISGEERGIAFEFLRLAIHVVHELVDQGDGDLLHLGFRVGHLADQDVAGGVNTGFGFGVKNHQPQEITTKSIQVTK